jgi:hypothetical protein
MTNPNKQNTLSSWITQGGNLWVLGGGIGNCTMATWNNRTNDIRRRIYTSFGIRPELVSGRFMFDVVHWRSEFMPLYGGVQTLTRIDQPDYRFDTSQPPQFPDNPFWPGGSYFTRPMRPEYLRGPTALNPKTPATDPLPPLRNPGDFYINTPDNAKGIDIEYLFKENRIVQDPDGVPDTGDEFSVLDTLYIAAWGGDGMNRWDYTGWDGVNPVMTVYRGQDAVQPVVFSGFNIWHFRRSDCLAMLDMVVNGMWQVPLPHLASSPPAFSRPTIGSALAQPGRVARPVAVRAPAGFRSPASAPVAPRRP